jgi:hypothetical protein
MDAVVEALASGNAADFFVDRNVREGRGGWVYQPCGFYG